MDVVGLPLGLAVLLTLAFTPVAKRLAVRVGAYDRPVARSVHARPMPHLGGLAMFAAFALTVVARGTGGREMWGILLGGAAMVALGIVDDFRGIHPAAKLAGQVAVALLTVWFGVRIEWITNPLGGMWYAGAYSIPLTVLWMIIVINTVNVVDGLDGLAAGICSIASLTLLFVALRAGQAHVVTLTAALAGCALGFLPYNFNPAKIFMGDAGSMFLGYALAAISVEGPLKSATTVALLIPVLALGLPLFDVSFAVVRRLLNGRPIYQADREHLHHRLLELGLTQRQVALVMYGVSGCLGLGAVLIGGGNARLGLVIVAMVVVLSLVVASRLGLLQIRPNRLGRH